MSQFLVLSHIRVQNANSIAGLTWGFPAITHFLGFTHALNRKLSNKYEGSYTAELSGCAVISHEVQNKIYQPKKFADFEFLQSKNPPVLAKHKSSSPPIIEEGKMNLTVSLVIELSQTLALTTSEINKLEQEIETLCYRMRLAGGTILNINNIKLLSATTKEQHDVMLKKIKRLTMPGFVLVDRSEYLQLHYQNLINKSNQEAKSKPQLFDAWLDFSAMKFKSIPITSQSDEQPSAKTPADWLPVSKPFSGYLVPLMTGFKAISELYEAGEVLNTRDEKTPSRFVEAIHSVGEWQGVHRISSLSNTIWRYEHDGQWYLCKQSSDESKSHENSSEMIEEETQFVNFNEALNLF
jgi:CRISPR-associated protein Csy2